MRPSDQLAQFVQASLSAGHSRDAIRDALTRAGWTGAEVSAALDAWADDSFIPPIPRPRPFVSAREAFLYGLMFIALAMTAWHLVALSFYLIDRWLPEVNDMLYATGSVQGMRLSIASLIVFLPLFVFLNSRLQQAASKDPGRRRSLVRKWFGYVTLFLASMALLGDLIAVLYALLNGDLTARFAAKTLVVAAVAGMIFVYFRGEMDDEETG